MPGGYDNRRSKKRPDYLTAEEYEVSMALRKGGYKREPQEITSFVPTIVLFQVYHRYIGGLQYRIYEDELPQDLGIRPFGAALNRVYDLDRGERLQRRWHGKKCWGYIGITGPEAILTRDEPGRPRYDED